MAGVGSTRSRRGGTSRDRERARERVALVSGKARPLLHGFDHGDPIVVRSEHIGMGRRNDRWVEPFLEANRTALGRLELRPEVAHAGELVLRMHPGPRIGAVPLVSPSTRKVAAGLLVRPRLRWTRLGDVVGRIGFAVEPAVGGGALVPGSAREVPPWLLAGPVLCRLEALLRHRRRVFSERAELRTSPRGRVAWSTYASQSVPHGRWHQLPCVFTEPQDDPELMAFVRWTLARVSSSIQELAPTPIGRVLLERIRTLELGAGPGPNKRPMPGLATGLQSEWLAHALEAMSWVSEERGLGGARTLDGLAWDMSVEQVWEHWVGHVLGLLAPRLGLAVLKGTETRHSLQWHGAVQSMGALIPDAGLRGRDRLIWVDAKYKAHLQLLARKGWNGLGPSVREAHRADLHQALAYAALANVDRVDTVLAYPVMTDEDHARPPVAIASIVTGTRRVRLLLAGLPFGFRSLSHQESVLAAWRELLAA